MLEKKDHMRFVLSIRLIRVMMSLKMGDYQHIVYFFFKVKIWFNLILQNEKKSTTQRKLRFPSNRKSTTLPGRVVYGCYFRSEIYVVYLSTYYFPANYWSTCAYYIILCRLHYIVPVQVVFFLSCNLCLLECFFTEMIY